MQSRGKKKKKKKVSWEDETAPCLHLTADNVELAPETLAEEMMVFPSTSSLLAGTSSVPEPGDAGARAQGWHAVLLTPTNATSCSALGRPHHKLKAQLLTALRKDFFLCHTEAVKY